MVKLLKKVLTPWIASRRSMGEFKKAREHYMKHGFLKHNSHAKAMERYDRIARHEHPFEEVEPIIELKLPSISKLKLPTPFEGTAKKIDLEKDKDKKKSNAIEPPKPVTEDTPTNAMGSSSTTSGPIQTYDPMLMVNVAKKHKTLKTILSRKMK